MIVLLESMPKVCKETDRMLLSVVFHKDKDHLFEYIVLIF